jgi:hypothetical protein
MAVPDEIDLLDTRSAVGHSGAREQGMHRSAALIDGGVDRVAFGQVHGYCRDARQ